MELLLLLTIGLILVTDMAVRRMIGDTLPARLNSLAWFSVPWMLCLVILAMPLLIQQDRIKVQHILYLAACFAAFSIGGLSHAAISQRGRARSAPGGSVFANDHTAFLWIAIALGVLGLLSQAYDQISVTGFGLGERMSSSNALELTRSLRNKAAMNQESGPLSKFERFAAFAYIYICILPLYWNRLRKEMKLLFGLAYGMLLVLILFNSVVITAGRVQIAIIGLCMLTSATLDSERTFFKIVLGRTRKQFFIRFTVVFVLMAIVFGYFATTFMENRLGRQSTDVVLGAVHRASIADWLVPYAGEHPTLKFLLVSLGYFTSPIPTLAYYLDLPSEFFPGPYFGQVHSPRFFIYLFSFTDPDLIANWGNEIDVPLEQYGYATNIWPTLLRELAFEVTRPGVPVVLLIFGYISNAVVSRAYHDRDPYKTAIAAALLSSWAWSCFHTILVIPTIYYMLVFSLFILGARVFIKPRKPRRR